MGERETEQFTKRVYTASNNPASLLHRTLVQKKNPSEEEAPYCRKLCKILQDLKKLSATKEGSKTEEWIQKTIPEIEDLINDTGVEHRGHALEEIINTIKGT
jgi:hypothetical protein